LRDIWAKTHVRKMIGSDKGGGMGSRKIQQRRRGADIKRQMVSVFNL